MTLDIGTVSLIIAAVGGIITLVSVHHKTVQKLDKISETQKSIAATCAKAAELQGKMMVEMQKMISDHEQQTQRLNDLWHAAQNAMHRRERGGN